MNGIEILIYLIAVVGGFLAFTLGAFALAFGSIKQIGGHYLIAAMSLAVMVDLWIDAVAWMMFAYGAVMMFIAMFVRPRYKGMVSVNMKAEQYDNDDTDVDAQEMWAEWIDEQERKDREDKR